MEKSRFAKFGSWMRSQNIFVFAVVLCAITVVLQLLLTAPVELGWVKDIEWFEKPSIENTGYIIIFTALFVAPIVETFLFQWLPMAILWRFKTFRNKRWGIVLIAALIFGSMHYYSLMYVVVAMVIGAVMMWGYIVRYNKQPFLTIAIYHFMWNLFVTLYDIVNNGLPEIN